MQYLKYFFKLYIMLVMKKGFTLSEMLIVLFFVSLIATFLMRVLQDNRPNKEKAMFRKAYVLVEQVTSELLNDKSFYPDFQENGIGFVISDIRYEDGKIVFSKANTNILMGTDIYSKYLIHYSNEFINTLDASYLLNAEIVHTLLNSNRFTIQEKRQIIDVTDENILVSSSLADKVIELLLDSNNISIKESILTGLLQHSTILRNKVLLVTKMLNVNQYSVEEISSLLVSLGGKYVEVAERKKRPLIDKNEENIALLNQLQSLHFISTTSQEDDGIRVNPTRKQNS